MNVLLSKSHGGAGVVSFVSTKDFHAVAELEK